MMRIDRACTTPSPHIEAVGAPSVPVEGRRGHPASPEFPPRLSTSTVGSKFPRWQAPPPGVSGQSARVAAGRVPAGTADRGLASRQSAGGGEAVRCGLLTLEVGGVN